MQLIIKTTALLATVLLATACSKRLDDPVQRQPNTYDNIASSVAGVRLINTCRIGYKAITNFGSPDFDVTINDRKLTTFSGRDYYGPTPWFSGGKFSSGNRFSIPDSLFDAKGDAVLKMYMTFSKTLIPPDYSGPYLDSPVLVLTMPLHNNPDRPQDVLVYDEMQATASRPDKYAGVNLVKALAMERSQVPPARQDYFKIRLINVAATNMPGPLDQLTLTYADGSSVNEKTTAVTARQVNEYVELPYGTYQFKVKDKSGRVLSEIPTDPFNYFDTTFFMRLSSGSNTYLTYNALHTYSPGGIYTIVGNWPVLPTEPGGNYNSLIQPAYTVTTDLAAAAVPNFIRIQGVHALPGVPEARFAVDGRPMGSLLRFGQGTAYSAFSIGPHKLQLLDDTGKELAMTMLNNTAPLDNISVWAYAAGGRPQLLLTYNDMSNMALLPGNGSGYSLLYNYSWHCRFLNLTETVPYASLVDSVAGDPLVTNYAPWQHVGAGVIPDAAATIFAYNSTYSRFTAVSLSAYNAPPGSASGTPLQVTLRRPMVANPDLYPPGKVPPAEPGVYTIALIGNEKAGVPLQLINIKHNQ
jgi:hypothetical protein